MIVGKQLGPADVMSHLAVCLQKLEDVGLGIFRLDDCAWLAALVANNPMANFLHVEVDGLGLVRLLRLLGSHLRRFVARHVGVVRRRELQIIVLCIMLLATRIVVHR